MKDKPVVLPDKEEPDVVDVYAYLKRLCENYIELMDRKDKVGLATEQVIWSQAVSANVVEMCAHIQGRMSEWVGEKTYGALVLENERLSAQLERVKPVNEVYAVVTGSHLDRYDIASVWSSGENAQEAVGRVELKDGEFVAIKKFKVNPEKYKSDKEIDKLMREITVDRFVELKMENDQLRKENDRLGRDLGLLNADLEMYRKEMRSGIL